jgi:hypothetical protein
MTPSLSSVSGVRLCPGPLARLAAACIGADAFVVGNRVFLSGHAAREIAAGSESGEALLAHELAHVSQYRALGVLPFLFRYFGQYFAGRSRGLSHGAAYAAISFEQEAEAQAESIRFARPKAGSPGDLPRAG